MSPRPREFCPKCDAHPDKVRSCVTCRGKGHLEDRGILGPRDDQDPRSFRGTHMRCRKCRRVKPRSHFVKGTARGVMVKTWCRYCRHQQRQTMRRRQDELQALPGRFH